MNNSGGEGGVRVMGEERRGGEMRKSLFWCQHNKGITKCCRILKARRFSVMICSYMDINSSPMSNFFRLLWAFLMNFVQICTRTRVGFKLW